MQCNIRILIFFLICSGFTFNVIASSKQDSLVNVWSNDSNPDSVRVSSILKYVESLHERKDKDTILYYLNRAFNLPHKNLGKNQKGQILMRKGIVYGNNRYFEESLKCFKEAADFYEDVNENEMVFAYLKIGLVHKILRNTKEAKSYFIKSIELSKKLKDESLLNESQILLGQLYYQLDDLDRAEELMLIVAKNLKDSINRTAEKAFAGLALINRRNGDLKKAIDNSLKSIKISEEKGWDGTLGVLYNNIASIYIIVEEYSSAAMYYRKSLSIKKKNEDLKGIAYAYHGMARLHESMKKSDSAFYYYRKTIRISDSVGLSNLLSFAYNNMGSLYINHNTDSARVYLTKALDMREEMDNRRALASSYKSLSALNLELGDYSSAINYGQKVLALKDEVNDIVMIKEVYKLLYDSYNKIGDTKSSLEMLENYVLFKDSVVNSENKNLMVRKQFEYEYEKQAALDSLEHAKEQKLSKATIAQQQAEADKKDAELEAKRNQQFALFGGLGLLLIFGGFMYNRFRITQKQKKIIENQKSEVESQRDIATKNHQEAERQRHIVEQKNSEITDSINYAKRLQTAILPPLKLVEQHFPNSFILFKPKDIVSGDFYWMETTKTHIFLAAADCTGHGVPGAMVSVVCANALNKAVNELGQTNPAEILSTTRKLVIETFSKAGSDVKDGMDISLCVIHKEGQDLQWAGANNPLWIVRHDRDELEEIKADKQPIGLYGELKPFTSHNVSINNGDSIYMFSDGYADQFGGTKGKKLKKNEFKRILLENKKEDMSEIKQILDSVFVNWKGGLEQIDDVCIVGVRF